jgi:MFS family permease
MALFSIASLACGLAPSAAVLVITRVCQGTGAAMMLPQSLSGIQINFTDQARMRAIGLYTAALSGGAVTGQILGGPFVSANIAGTLWRPIFLLNVPVGLVILAGAFRNLPKDHRDTDSDQAVSAGLIADPAVGCLRNGGRGARCGVAAVRAFRVFGSIHGQGACQSERRSFRRQRRSASY